MSERFALAPMDGLNRGLTTVTLPLPGVMLAAGAWTPVPLLGGVGVLMLALWAFIWLYMRPSRFEVGPAGLRVRWPWRSELVPRRALAGAEILSRREIKERYGYAMRVGAGGLGGGFGLAWTNQGFLRLYVSRIDRFVIVHCREGRDWMITPADPERFVAAIGGGAGGIRQTKSAESRADSSSEIVVESGGRAEAAGPAEAKPFETAVTLAPAEPQSRVDMSRIDRVAEIHLPLPS